MTQSQIIQMVSEGFEKARDGAAINVYRTVCPLHDDGTLPLRSHYAFGWIIYYALHYSAPADIAGRKQMLARYLKLSLEKPHKLHSMILTEALRLYRDSRDAAFNRRDNDPSSQFSIVRFARLWQLSNLRPGDWRRKEHDGHTLTSTAEKLITLCVDELELTSGRPSEEFVAVIDKAVAEYADSFNILAQRARIHQLAGESDQAACLLRKALLYAPGKFFLWSRLASLVDPQTDIHLHVALLYKALRSPGQDQFKGRIRLSLAHAWSLRGMPAQALWELDRVKRLYEANQWHLPHACARIAASIPADTAPADPDPLYRRVEHMADDYIYSALEAVEVVKTYHKNPDPKGRYGTTAAAWRVTDAQGRNYWLQPHRFRIPADLPAGTRLVIRVHNGKPVAASLPSAE